MIVKTAKGYVVKLVKGKNEDMGYRAGQAVQAASFGRA